MDSEEERVVAFVFKRLGKDRLSFNEFYFTISFDLNWFDPNEAKEFVNNAIKNKLLVKEKNFLKPNLEINKIDIPLGFYPSNKWKKTEVVRKDVFEKIVERITDSKSIDKKIVLDKIKDIEENKGLISEVAALIICKEYNIEIDDLFDEVEDKVFS